MAKVRMEDLQRHLFATIEGLLDTDSPMDVNRAKAVASTAQVIVDSARAETEHMAMLDRCGMDVTRLDQPAIMAKKLIGGQ